MTHPTATVPQLTIGVDLSDRTAHLCVLAADGEVIGRSKISLSSKSLGNFFARYAGARVAYEVGTHSAWVTMVLDSLGCETIVANARKVAAISKNRRKNDTTDAELLARLARVDVTLLSPIKHRGPQAQMHRTVLRARDALVRARTRLVNCVRGLVKPHGYRIASCSTTSFHKRAVEQLPAELRSAITPLVDMIGVLTTEIRDYDKQIEQISESIYPETAKLRQIQGVGFLTALGYVLAVEDPSRFSKSRHAGPFFGLVPRQFASGKMDPELRITKTGDKLVRRLLVNASQYIMGPFAEDSDLRRFGHKLADRGGKNARKRAVVALSRKLSVLLHRLWTSSKPYEPLRQASLAGETP
jgi:transposase